jgi:hypothetical protein
LSLARPLKMPRPLVVTILLLIASGCELGHVGGGPPGADGGPVASELDRHLIEAVRGQRYRGAGFISCNAAPYPTELHATRNAYAAIEPAVSASGVHLPVGAVIVREVVAAGEVTALTVMAKAEPGHFDEGGEWAYAVMTPDGGAFLADDAGLPIRGRYPTCVSCHADRADDDSVFGVPPSYRFRAARGGETPS